ncbi:MULTISPECIES: class I SAM-dependent DNA methyltransferase [unclassified Leisingera]|uniref:class I SAM-dependent DNA methyltransferase n=2 Tax=Leisingera TaxID=191028 RepID=UPI0002F1BD8B|nr:MULTISPECIES: class I SAM-dependent methyltransferase [unclassified Leisingera]KIC21751.1 SAM-dependent methlyltransferase [Leisingera sp. ANG-S3]KIC32554.1 SAM-dependent methlyltransferase [Leisingera sp. ANG-S5]KID07826.1 SAM-dependent methlyltransferase [Leisingera sp. ANG1]
MSDDRTISVYDDRAADYAELFTGRTDPGEEADFQAFTARLPEGGTLLDLGCGPGHWAARFRDAGFRVAALDASPEMAEAARAAYGIEVITAGFHALDAEAVFDGIWAYFSLLHVPREELSVHLTALRRALTEGGTLCLAMKLGESEGRDELGRFYAYYSEDELREKLETAGFTLLGARRGTGKGLAGTAQEFVVLTAHA